MHRAWNAGVQWSWLLQHVFGSWSFEFLLQTEEMFVAVPYDIVYRLVSENIVFLWRMYFDETLIVLALLKWREWLCYCSRGVCGREVCLQWPGLCVAFGWHGQSHPVSGLCCCFTCAGIVLSCLLLSPVCQHVSLALWDLCLTGIVFFFLWLLSDCVDSASVSKCAHGAPCNPPCIERALSTFPVDVVHPGYRCSPAHLSRSHLQQLMLQSQVSRGHGRLISSSCFVLIGPFGKPMSSWASRVYPGQKLARMVRSLEELQCTDHEMKYLIWHNEYTVPCNLPEVFEGKKIFMNGVTDAQRKLIPVQSVLCRMPLTLCRLRSYVHTQMTFHSPDLFHMEYMCSSEHCNKDMSCVHTGSYDQCELYTEGRDTWIHHYLLLLEIISAAHLKNLVAHVQQALAYWFW